MNVASTGETTAGGGRADASVLAAATVLVVDDHVPNLTLLERILTQAGVTRVQVTTDPTAVMELYAKFRPDLVLLDLHMPGMDGVAVLDALARATAPGEFVPVIVLTADATPEARNRVLDAGASDFLTKPFDRAEVVLRARNLLYARMLHFRLRAQNADLQAEVDARNAADERARAAAMDKRRRIEDVLNDGGLRIVFQPIVQLDTLKIVGYEALARFDGRPQRPPNIWFAEAADVGLSLELELAAVRAALEHVASLPDGTFLTLNVSPASMTTPELADLLAPYARDRLILEITEHAQVADYDELLGALTRLRQTGARFAVDDAGAGYASLYHILRLRQEVIKLDISLVRGIHGDPVKRALASSLVTFGLEIGSDLIAEGIETAEDLTSLVALGIAWGQGYHLYRPDHRLAVGPNGN